MFLSSGKVCAIFLLGAEDGKSSYVNYLGIILK
jgi:hypothetical protein